MSFPLSTSEIDGASAFESPGPPATDTPPSVSRRRIIWCLQWHEWKTSPAWYTDAGHAVGGAVSVRRGCVAVEHRDALPLPVACGLPSSELADF